MKKRLTVGVVLAVFAASLTFVAASSIKHEPVTDADALPAYEILTTVRSMGLNPLSEPLRRGPYYILHAADARGVEMRVVADAQLGDIVSVTPAQRQNTANYQRGPRIIHVPQADESDQRANSRASVDERDEPDVGNDDDDAEPAAAPQYRLAPLPSPPRKQAPAKMPRWRQPAEVTPPPQRRSDAPPPPPPPSQRRAVLSVPPPPAEGPTPIRPTPRFGQADQGEKFASPRSELPPADAVPGAHNQ